jgi:two-component system sensor histidine kinase PilS (NtrC family)
MRKKLHWLALLRLATAGLLIATIKFFESPPSPRTQAPLIAAIIVSATSLVLIRTRLPLIAQARAQIFLDLALVTWLVYQSGDLQSPFLALYLVVIFATSSLFGRKDVLLVAAFGATLYAGSMALALSGVWERPGQSAANQPGAALVVVFNLAAIFAVALLSSQLAERLRHSENRLAEAKKDLADYRLFNDRIIESIRSGLITTDLRGNIMTFNRAAEEITGYKAEEVCGKHLFTIFGNIEKQIEEGIQLVRTRPGLPRFEIGCKTADGRDIHLGFSVAPLVDESELSRGYVVTFQDLTEVMELEREVRRQERLAALGKMAAGLAHEIRNPLTSMRGSIKLLASELELSPEQSKLIEIVLRESDRLDRIVSDFLVYARPPKTEKSDVDLKDLLAETMALFRNSTELRPDHVIIEEYDESAVRYSADQNQMRQIFWNLARNAIQAMPEGGTLRVRLEAPPGSDVTITFSDTGEGMVAEQKDRLFEPFNSSRGSTGLGMAIVYQLVRDHGGKIIVDSEPGRGTTITVRLPACGRLDPEAARIGASTAETLLKGAIWKDCS